MSTIGVAAASYEGSLFSWKGDCSKSGEGSTACALSMTSGFHCCAGSIRSLSTSASGRYMACGGTDERIHIFNMLENSTLGELSTHTGAVTCLDFFEDSHLLSGSDDNSICIWRTHDWMCVHILGGHKASINCVSIHPSGKLAVSVAQDNTLKVWNLVQGRIAFTRRLKGSANLVKWMKPSGAAYMLVVGDKIEVYATSDNSSIAVIQHETRVNQADFFGSQGQVVSICEDRALRLFNAQGEMISMVDFSSLNTRIRDFSLVSPSSVSVAGAIAGDETGKEIHVVTVATSDGKILLVDLSALQLHPPAVLAEDIDFPATPLQDVLIDTFSIKAEPRLTCISAWVQGNKKKKGGAGVKKVRKNKSKKAVNIDHIDGDKVSDSDDIAENTTEPSKKRKENNKSGKSADEEAGTGAGLENSRKKVRFSGETADSKKQKKSEGMSSGSKKQKR